MKTRLLGAVGAGSVIFSTNCAAALIASYSYGSSASVSGSQNTLTDILPGRFHLVYGDLLLCQGPPDCDFWDPNPAPPDATVFDIEIAESVTQTFILHPGPDFDAVVNLATDGNLDQMNYGLEYRDGTGHWSLGWTEDFIYDSSGDLSGFRISHFELIMHATFDSPGRDLNRDGIWVDRNDYWTFNVHGTPVPIPLALYLFAAGLLGLIGVARRKAA